MAGRNPAGSLTRHEKKIAKALLQKGWRNQDIQALINIGRKATINSARITEVKQDGSIAAASDQELEFYQVRKKSFDAVTGLNLYDDERLIRSRESMLLAVQAFNSPTLDFKTEVFAVLANVAWTYLLHEYYSRKRVKIQTSDGKTISLSQMLKRSDCPLTGGAKNNLKALKVIRDEVEHQLMGKSDYKWASIYQACCLNFDKVICDLFGAELSLQSELSFALQFAKMNIEQLKEIQKYEVPRQIEAVDAQLEKMFTDDQRADIEYQFRIVYTFDSASKGNAHMHFVSPDSDDAEQIRNVLTKSKIADDQYPLKPSRVVQQVNQKSSHRFTSRNHTQAWRLYKTRPKEGSRSPRGSNREFCIYHQAHKDYTYSEQWVDHLVKQLDDPIERKRIYEFRLK